MPFMPAFPCERDICARFRPPSAFDPLSKAPRNSERAWFAPSYSRGSQTASKSERELRSRQTFGVETASGVYLDHLPLPRPRFQGCCRRDTADPNGCNSARCFCLRLRCRRFRTQQSVCDVDGAAARAPICVPARDCDGRRKHNPDSGGVFFAEIDGRRHRALADLHGPAARWRATLVGHHRRRGRICQSVQRPASATTDDDVAKNTQPTASPPCSALRIPTGVPPANARCTYDARPIAPPGRTDVLTPVPRRDCAHGEPPPCPLHRPRFRDVMFGEVWHCSGQSNVSLPVNLLKHACLFAHVHTRSERL